MTDKRREPGAGRREPREFVRRAAAQGETRAALPHAFLKQRAQNLMKQPMRTDLFRPAFQPHEVEEVFIPRAFNFVEGGSADEAAPPPAEEPRTRAVRRRPEEEEERIEPQIDLAESGAPEEDDLDLPPSRPREAEEKLDLPDLEEYDGSDLFDQDDPDLAAEPAIPAEERTELPSALRNRRNYFENSDQRKSNLLGGIIPGSGRPAAKAGPRRPAPKSRPKGR